MERRLRLVWGQSVFFYRAVPMSDKLRVVIVDDHALMREGLRHVIQAHPRFELAGEAGDGEAALELILKRRPDVAVLDIRLPSLSGLQVAERLRGVLPPVRVVFLTMYKEEELFNKAMDCGASGYLLKESSLTELVQCLQAVAAGQEYLSPAISSFMVRRLRRVAQLRAERPGLATLTASERRVLRLIAENKTSREIAAELGVSPRTVDAHRANLCAKLNLHGSHPLLRFALEHRHEI